VTVVDRHSDLAVLAVQGPRSAELLAAAGLPVAPAYLSFTTAGLTTAGGCTVASSTVAGGGADPAGGQAEDTIVVCRTGYTGEHGYELIVSVRSAGSLWDRLLAVGAPLGVLPCGLGARDTLRTEAGYPLHGQDLSREISPVQAGLGWAVGWRKPAFAGREALLAERAAGPGRRLVGLETVARAVPRPATGVLAGTRRIGVVTSGTFSPTKRVGIALALLDSDAGWSVGDQVELDLRGRRIDVVIVKPPFVPSRVR
jgi:aminomethyltransferase